MATTFEHRSPRPDDVIEIGMVDLREGDRWLELGQSRAWCWQQGCMLQWRPGSATEVLWNDRVDDRFVCHVLDVRTRERRTIPSPIYTVTPDGATAVGLDFGRVQRMRPGYGYAGVPDRHRAEAAPATSGLFRIDIDTGKSARIVSLAQVAGAAEKEGAVLKGATHYFNHLLASPDGKRFIFLHRWRHRSRRGFGTRMLTARLDGSDIRVVDGSGHTSHFIWRDARHILAWTRRPEAGAAFYLFEDADGGKVEVIGRKAMPKNGHCTYLPGHDGAWILNDTYPDRQRRQHPYLFHVPSGRRVPLGHFLSPKEYRGEWRCDLHPRASRDGRSIVIDSPHGGSGRQLWLIDVGRIVG